MYMFARMYQLVRERWIRHAPNCNTHTNNLVHPPARSGRSSMMWEERNAFHIEMTVFSLSYMWMKVFSLSYMWTKGFSLSQTSMSRIS